MFTSQNTCAKSVLVSNVHRHGLSRQIFIYLGKYLDIININIKCLHPTLFPAHQVTSVKHSCHSLTKDLTSLHTWDNIALLTQPVVETKCVIFSAENWSWQTRRIISLKVNRNVTQTDWITQTIIFAFRNYSCWQKFRHHAQNAIRDCGHRKNHIIHSRVTKFWKTTCCIMNAVSHLESLHSLNNSLRDHKQQRKCSILVKVLTASFLS